MTKKTAAQEEFTVVKKTLTAEAKSRQTDPYIRSVIQKGLGNKATLVSEGEAIRSDFPTTQPVAAYSIERRHTSFF